MLRARIAAKLSCAGIEKTQNSPFIQFILQKLTGALCYQHTGSSNCLDLLLGPSAEEFSLDDDGLLGQFAFAENFVVTLQTKKSAKSLMSHMLYMHDTAHK